MTATKDKMTALLSSFTALVLAVGLAFPTIALADITDGEEDAPNIEAAESEEAPEPGAVMLSEEENNEFAVQAETTTSVQLFPICKTIDGEDISDDLQGWGNHALGPKMPVTFSFIEGVPTELPILGEGDYFDVCIDGYKFAGWGKGGGVVFAPGDTISHSHADPLFPLWEPVATPDADANNNLDTDADENDNEGDTEAEPWDGKWTIKLVNDAGGEPVVKTMKQDTAPTRRDILDAMGPFFSGYEMTGYEVDEATHTVTVTYEAHITGWTTDDWADEGWIPFEGKDTSNWRNPSAWTPQPESPNYGRISICPACHNKYAYTGAFSACEDCTEKAFAPRSMDFSQKTLSSMSELGNNEEFVPLYYIDADGNKQIVNTFTGFVGELVDYYINNTPTNQDELAKWERQMFNALYDLNDEGNVYTLTSGLKTLADVPESSAIYGIVVPRTIEASHWSWVPDIQPAEWVFVEVVPDPVPATTIEEEEAPHAIPQTGDELNAMLAMFAVVSFTALGVLFIAIRRVFKKDDETAPQGEE